jgi:DNA-binding NtrC family response regulator
MPPTLRVLFVDDEETFLESSCDLLRREGYTCNCTRDVGEASDWLRVGAYDLVIADINMPGNANLEFVRQLAAQDDPVPVILVTAYPSITSAIESLELSVVAYLVKPFEFSELVGKVQSAARRVLALRAVREELDRLRDYRQSLLRTELLLRDSPGGQPLRTFVDVAMHNVIDILASLRSVVDQSPGAEAELLQWPAARGDGVREVLRDAVATLERTKSAFKSKELGELRRKLEGLLNG